MVRMAIFVLALLLPFSSYAQRVALSHAEAVGPLAFVSTANRTASEVDVLSTHGWLFKTLDNGQTFERQLIDDTVICSSIAFADSLHGMIATNYGYPFSIPATLVYVTNDGGKTWHSSRTPIPFPMTVAYPSIDTAYIGTMQCGVWRSTDRGLSWIQQSMGDTAEKIFDYKSKALCFLNSKVGIEVGEGGNFWRTSDAGAHWLKQDIGAGDSIPLNGIDFRGADTAIIVGWGHYYITTDAGASWVDHTMPGSSWNILNIVKWTGKTSFLTLGPAGQYYTSTDFGKTLQVTLLNAAFSQEPVLYSLGQSASGGYVVGGSLGTLYSIDASGAFSLRSQLPTWSLRSLQKAGDKLFATVTAVGSEPMPFSTDGGVLWDRVYPNPQAILKWETLTFTSPTTASAFCTDAYEARTTTDAGSSWQFFAPNFPIQQHVAYTPLFGSGYHGYWLENTNTVLATNDAGRNWAIRDSLPPIPASPIPGAKLANGVSLRMSAPDSLHAFFLRELLDTLAPKSGDTGKFYRWILDRTVDGGASWTASNVFFAKVAGNLEFLDSLNGYIVRDSSILMVTSDGGLSWNEWHLPTSRAAKCVAFLNRDVGVVGLDTSAILLTTDRGTTWRSIAVPIPSHWSKFQVSSAFFSDTNTLFLVWKSAVDTGNVIISDGGLYRIHVIRPSETGTVAQGSGLEPIDAILIPNPAKSKSTLRFSLEKEEAVEVQVFNVLGHAVCAAVNSTLQAGVHRIKIDCSDLATGTYWVHLRAGNRETAYRLEVQE